MQRNGTACVKLHYRPEQPNNHKNNTKDVTCVQVHYRPAANGAHTLADEAYVVQVFAHIFASCIESEYLHKCCAQASQPDVCGVAQLCVRCLLVSKVGVGVGSRKL
jgi:hypothetical protein